jgi:hypothetical protein
MTSGAGPGTLGLSVGVRWGPVATAVNLHGRGRSRAPPARGRQGGGVPAQVGRRQDVAAGGRLLVDVEFGRGHRLYALSQGVFTPGNPEGSPAEPNTGALVKANRDGTFTVLVDRLNQPTSLEFIGKTAYVVTLSGEIWKIQGI